MAYSNYYLTIGNIQISQNQYLEGEQKISFISYVYTKNSSNNISTNVSINNSVDSNSTNLINSNLTDKDIINEAIQTTGAASLIDIVKIIKHIKEKTGKDIDENLAISILQERLNNL